MKRALKASHRASWEAKVGASCVYLPARSRAGTFSCQLRADVGIPRGKCRALGEGRVVPMMRATGGSSGTPRELSVDSHHFQAGRPGVAAPFRDDGAGVVSDVT